MIRNTTEWNKIDWKKPIEYLSIDLPTQKEISSSLALHLGSRLNGEQEIHFIGLINDQEINPITFIADCFGRVVGWFRWRTDGKFETGPQGDHQTAYFVRNAAEIPREKLVRSEIVTETHKAYIYEDGRIEVIEL